MTAMLIYIIVKTFLLFCDCLVIIIDHTSQYSTSDISHCTQRQRIRERRKIEVETPKVIHKFLKRMFLA